jgi:hypothetical protein
MPIRIASLYANERRRPNRRADLAALPGSTEGGRLGFPGGNGARLVPTTGEVSAYVFVVLFMEKVARLILKGAHAA